MAQKRMFNKSITNSSMFLMMPQSSQNLYFHLGMNADDDGFCEHFTIMRMTESKPDDLKILQAKGFVHVFDDKVLVIKDWKENNYIRSDRYTPSKYLDIYKNEILTLSEGKEHEIKCLPSGIPEVNQMDTQIRLDKIRLDKISEDNNPSNNDTLNFDKFWTLYDKKVGKENTLKQWMKLKVDDSLLKIILSHVTKLKKTTEKKFRKDPERYLKNKCWNDEIMDERSQSKYQDL